MSNKQVLESAAAVIEKLAQAVAEGVATQDQLAQKLAAAQELTKKANDGRAAIAGLAKTAADAALSNGLVRSEQSRDELAVELLDHDKALEHLAKVASEVEAKSPGKVVVASAAAEEDADTIWARHVTSLGY